MYTIASKPSAHGGSSLDASAGRRPDRRSAPGPHATIDQRIWLTVSAIPAGCIATYGDVAERAGLPGAARRVGAALRRLPPDSAVPWHRVVNARGRSSLPPGARGADRQLALLAAEGVLLGSGGRAVIERYRWS